MSRGGGFVGRGGRGGFGGHAGTSRGPQLPWSLQQQVGGGAPAGNSGRGGGSSRGRGGGRGSFARGSGRPLHSNTRPGRRKQQRKAARQDKKHQRYEHQQQHAQQRHTGQQQQQQQAGSKRPHEVPSAAQNPAKRLKHTPQPQQQQKVQQKHTDHTRAAAAAAPGSKARLHHNSSSSSGPAGTKKTMFYDLLADQGVVAPTKAAAAAAAAAAGGSLSAAFLQDLRTERELARKLKIKKTSQRSGPEDGLDTFLSGITQLLPDSLKQQAAAAAEEDEEMDDEDFGDTHSGAGSDSGGELSDPFGLGGSESGEDESSDGEGLGFDQDSGDHDDDGADDDDMGGLGQGESSDEDEELSSQGLVSDVTSEGDEGTEDEPDDMLQGQSGSSGSGSGNSSSSLGDEVETDGGGSSEQGGANDSDGDQHLQQQQQQQQRRGRQRRLKHQQQGELESDDSGSSSEGEEEAEEQQQQQPAAAVPSAAKYIPPALRRAQGAAAAAAGQAGGDGGSSSSLPTAIQRRITGLLNRLAEANLQGIVRDILGVYETEGRRAVAEAVSAGLLAAVAEGPRATEQFAAVVAVFMAGLAASARAQDISARFLEQSVVRLGQAYAAGDGLACHNLIMLLAYCYSAGMVAADCMYSVLGELTRRFTEADVAMMLTLLNAVGLQLRAADPAAMKDFVLAVHTRAASTGASGGMSKRAEIMLELVMDIKNNRLREGKASKAAAAAAAAAGKKGGGGAAAVLQPGLLKWLRQLGVDDVTLCNISWAKLVQPNKKGMWWHPAATDAAAGLLPGVLADTVGSSAAAMAAAAAAAAADADEGVLPGAAQAEGAAGGAAVGAGQLLQLAAGLRMSTDVRRAVFVAIMGSEDCAEACEKLLRLPLKGDQSREVVRVLVECCLQEARYNPYYGHLAARLAAVSKGYKVTLQFCLWDQWKTVTSTEPRRLLCLAGLVGQLLSGCVLPLSSLKPIDFDAAASWTSKETFLWRHTLQLLLTGFASDADCEAAVARLATQQVLGSLSKGLGTFLKLRVGPWLVAQGDSGALKAQAVDVCLRRLARAEKVLLSSAAAVLAG